MKRTFFSKTIRTIGLTALLTVMVGANVQQVAQAQLGVVGEAYMPCSEAYFSDPDFMYGLQGSEEFLDLLRQRGQLAQFEQDQKPILDALEAIRDEITVFYVELDAPIGYVANKVNGVDIEIPPEIEQAMQEGMAYPYSREKVKVLNEKYSEYATFGQQLTLLYSPDQAERMTELLREDTAIVTSYFTPEEKQEYRDLISSDGVCNVNYGFVDMGISTVVVEVGERPDLDARLREDITGATLFK
jgi:hypothetical protein